MTDVFSFFPHGDNSEDEIKMLNEIFNEPTCSDSKADKITNYYFTPLIIGLSVVFLLLYFPNIQGSLQTILLIGIMISGIAFLTDQYIDGWRDKNPICSPD